MSSPITHQILQTIVSDLQTRPIAIEFETAYQVRVAIDRIRFAIRQTEQFDPHTDPVREAGLQLLDALQRLEAIDRRFQERSRVGSDPSNPKTQGAHEGVNGQ